MKMENYKLTFAETIPESCKFSPEIECFPKIGESIIKILQKAKNSIKAISFFFSLRAIDSGDSPCKATEVGENIYKELQEAAKRGVNLYLLANKRRKEMKDADMSDLQKLYPKNVNVGFIDMSHKTKGYVGGVCHTKLWIVDDQYFFVGSPNMCWRSYAENVETGIIGENCPSILNQLNVIFKEHWMLATECENQNKVLKDLSNVDVVGDLSTQPNEPLAVRISTSPDIISDATQTQNDIFSLLDVINTSQNHLYLTTYQYGTHDHLSQPPLIDLRVQNALILAAKQRNVDIKIIVDVRCTHNKLSRDCLTYLSEVQGINIKIFDTKEFLLSKISLLRLYHSKLAVSESKLWISTNNIEPSYFHLTCGIGLLFDTTVAPLKDVTMKLLTDATNHFSRYWNSNYVEPFEPSSNVSE